MSVVSISPSLQINDIVANIRAIYIRRRPACAVLAKIGELGLQLYSLEVGPCPHARSSCPQSTAVEQGLRGTSDLVIYNNNGGDVCESLKRLLSNFSFSWTRRRGVIVHRYTKPHAAEDRERSLCAALMGRLGRLLDGEVRFQAWSLVDAACDHRKALQRITQEDVRDDLNWFTANCACDVSWCASYLATPPEAESIGSDDDFGLPAICCARVASREDLKTQERERFEDRFQAGTCADACTQRGRWDEAREWIMTEFGATGRRSVVE
eukprot:Polyplicarium_translucidae@DN2922_c0_g1_i5.p2